MGNYGLKIGPNIERNTNLELDFTSKLSSLKLYKWGNVELTTDGSAEGDVEIYHNLGYVPVSLVFKRFDGQFTFLSATEYKNAWHDAESNNSYDSAGVFFVDRDTQKIRIHTQAIGGIGGGPSPNTTYFFRYMIFVDKSEAFSLRSNVAFTKNIGFKAAMPGKDVLLAKEHDLDYSSKYKALQYYDKHIKSSSLTLPTMWASFTDQDAQEATYVDFEHGLGYPPFFLVFSDLGTAYLYEVPYFNVFPSGLSYEGVEEISAFCDKDRIRVLWQRQSTYISGTTGEVFSNKTISIAVIIFAESLIGLPSP